MGEFKAPDVYSKIKSDRRGGDGGVRRAETGNPATLSLPGKRGSVKVLFA